MKTTEEYDCPVVGDGLTPDTAFRPKLPAGVDWSGPTPEPGMRVTVSVRAEAAKHAEIRADKDVKAPAKSDAASL